MTDRARLRLCTSGYGRAALDALAGVVAEAKGDDPLAPVTILVPNTVAGIVARRHLAAGTAGTTSTTGATGTTSTVGTTSTAGTGTIGSARTAGSTVTADPSVTADSTVTAGSGGIAGLTVTTVDRLAEQLAAPLLAPAVPATAPVVAAAWRAALRVDAGIFAPVADHRATVRALARAHAELREVDDEGVLDEIAVQGSLGADLIRLHRQVRAALRGRFYDRTDLLTAAARALARDAAPGEQHPPGRWTPAGEWGIVVLYLPQAITPVQGRFLRTAAGLVDLVVLAGLTGVDRADTVVHRTLGALGLDPPRPGSKPPTAHRVRHASDSDDEVRETVRGVLAALGRHPAHRIAVLHTGAVPYGRLLHEHLGRAGVTINGPGVTAVADRAVVRGLLGLLELAGTDLPRADLFRALAEAPVRGDGGRPIPLSTWERISRSAGVVGGSDWTVRLDAYGAAQQAAVAAENGREDPHPGRIDAANRQIGAAGSLRDFVISLRGDLDTGATLTDWPSLSAWALSLLHRLFRDGSTDGSSDVGAEGSGHGYTGLPPAEQYAAAGLEGILAGMAGLAEFEPIADLTALRETLAIAMETALPRVGRFGDGVLVAPLSAAIGLDVDEAFVLGLAEDLYPGRMHPDPLLPDEVRGAAAGALRQPRDAIDARHRHLLAAMACAPRVTASFPRGDLRRSTIRLPSRWLLPTLRELCGDTELAATQWESVRSRDVAGAASHAAQLLAAELPATEQEWRIRRLASDGRLADPALQAAVTMIRARTSDEFTRFDGNLAGAAGLPDFTDGRRRVSPTALESYAECPHAFFLRRMLRIEPLQSPEETITLSALDIGNLVHRSMDRLLRRSAETGLPGYGEPWPQAARQLLAEVAAEVAAEYETSGATGHPRLWERERRRIFDDLALMLDDDDAWRAGQNAAVVASELAFGMDGFEPVTVALPGGRCVLMVGSADKIDRTRDGTLLVTDIKTGSARRFDGIGPDDPLAGGTRLQLPVYAHAARARLGDGTTPVTAQYWFVRKDRGKRIEVRLDEEVEARYSQALHTLVSSIAAGLFPAKAPDAPDFAWVQCPYCNPDGIGHVEAREAWERKRMAPGLARLVALIDPQAVTA